MKSSSAEFPVSDTDTDKTDKTPCSGPGIRLGILAPGVLSEGPASHNITQGLLN